MENFRKLSLAKFDSNLGIPKMRGGKKKKKKK